MVLGDGSWSEYPLLIFPDPIRASRSKRGGGSERVKLPDAGRQAERIVPQFQRLNTAMEQRRAVLQANPLGIQPELALVLEAVGSVQNLVDAVNQVAGLEWLGEMTLSDIPPDDDFQYERRSQRQMNGQLFLTMSDQRALAELQRLFDFWGEQPNADFSTGLAPLKQVFAHLRTIRPWSAEDRLRDTGVLDAWQIDIDNNFEVVSFEAELWYRNGVDKRQQAEVQIRSVIEALEGEVVQQCVIQEIEYHALLGRIPVARASEIIAQTEVMLLQCDEMMYLRPVGQCAVPAWQDDSPEQVVNGAPQSTLLGEPVVALFDGLPLAGHQMLQTWVEIDDPDVYEDAYQAQERRHGTGMASLICHGDLDGQVESLSRKLYVRPILKPRRSFGGQFEENVPDDVLLLDLVHRAVRRLYEAGGDEAAVAPSIRIINLSVCDPRRPLENSVSSLARLLDWLSYRYNVLFIVSAGNRLRDLELDVPRDELGNLSEKGRLEAVLKALATDTRHRRLLSPAETVNGITVGADHADESTPFANPDLIDPFQRTPSAGHHDSLKLPSTISAHGPGYQRSIKPEITLPGGRQFLKEPLVNSEPNAMLEVSGFSRPPGQLVATPGPQGQLNRTYHTRGTSNAAALASRGASLLYDLIAQLRSRYGANIPPEYDTVLIKALLVHGADWSGNGSLYESVLKNEQNRRTFKDYVARFLGYGSADIGKASSCSEHRVSVLGFGSLSDGSGTEFSLPLPPSLSARTDKRRLTITLGWISPITSSSQAYRVAQLWFDPKNSIAPNRMYADHRAVQRGTVQHEILEGDKAAVFQDGDSIRLKVSCRATVGRIISPVRFGLVVTLEVAEGIDIPIYQEVRDRLLVPVPIVAGSAS